MSKREHHIAQPQGDSYLFNFPLTEDGLNYGSLPESTYIGKLRNYGSTGNTPNFNDNLVFDSTYGELAHKHTGCADKLVSIISESFNINMWLNDNDWELNLDFYFLSYNGYQQILEMIRCYRGDTLGIEIRWLSSNYGMLYAGGGNTLSWIGNNPTHVTQQWVNFNIIKIGTSISSVVTRMSDSVVTSTKTQSWINVNTTDNPKYITLFGLFLDGNSLNSQRYTRGATKNFYLKKL